MAMNSRIPVMVTKRSGTGALEIVSLRIVKQAQRSQEQL